MLKIKYEYSGKHFFLCPFNTSQEKELLLLGTIGESNIDNALSICNVDDNIISSLSENEKIAMLYKFREISVGDEINLQFKCKHCGSGNENSLSILNIIESSNITNPKIKDAFKVLTNNNFNEFVNIDIDDLDVDEYDQIYEEVKNTITKFNYIKPIICQKCGETNYTRIDTPSFVVDNLSDDSLISLYQTYNDLIFFGHYTKQDIDSLYPFERTILISLLNKTREDMNK